MRGGDVEIWYSGNEMVKAWWNYIFLVEGVGNTKDQDIYWNSRFSTSALEKKQKGEIRSAGHKYTAKQVYEPNRINTVNGRTISSAYVTETWGETWEGILGYVYGIETLVTAGHHNQMHLSRLQTFTAALSC